MKKETITIQVDYEIEYESGHKAHAIEKAMRLSDGSGGTFSKATRLANTIKLVKAPDA